jgi:hypothetical protein
MKMDMDVDVDMDTDMDIDTDVDRIFEDSDISKKFNQKSDMMFDSSLFSLASESPITGSHMYHSSRILY